MVNISLKQVCDADCKVCAAELEHCGSKKRANFGGL